MLLEVTYEETYKVRRSVVCEVDADLIQEIDLDEIVENLPYLEKLENRSIKGLRVIAISDVLDDFDDAELTSIEYFDERIISR